MTLDEILKNQCGGKTIADIKKIYHGLNHCCRCGCGGNYFEPGERGFTRAINRMNKPDFSCFDVEYTEHNGTTWVNIPENYTNDMCYCIYFN